MAPTASQKPPVEASRSWSVFNPYSWSKPKVKVAHLPEESSMYFHPELKRWVERGKEDEALNDPGSAPPPKTSMLASQPSQTGLPPLLTSGPSFSGPSSSGPSSQTRKALSSRYVLQSNLSISSSNLATDAGGGIPGGSGLTPSSSASLLPSPPQFFMPAAAPLASRPSDSGDISGAGNNAPTPFARPQGLNFFVPPPPPPPAPSDSPMDADPSVASNALGESLQEDGNTTSYHEPMDRVEALLPAPHQGFSGPSGDPESSHPLTSVPSGNDAPPTAGAWGGYAAMHAAVHTDAGSVNGLHAGGDAMGLQDSEMSPPYVQEGGAQAYPNQQYDQQYGQQYDQQYSQQLPAVDALGQGGGPGIEPEMEGGWTSDPSSKYHHYHAEASMAGWAAPEHPASSEHQPHHQWGSYLEEAAQPAIPASDSLGGQWAAATDTFTAHHHDGDAVSAVPPPSCPHHLDVTACEAPDGSSSSAVVSPTDIHGHTKSISLSTWAAQQGTLGGGPSLPLQALENGGSGLSFQYSGSHASQLHQNGESNQGGSAPQQSSGGLQSKGRELFGALAGIVQHHAAGAIGSAAAAVGFGSSGGAVGGSGGYGFYDNDDEDGDGDSDGDGFDRAMHPGDAAKLDGPLPWELPDHLLYSDQFLSICTAWQRNNPGKLYRPEMLLPEPPRAMAMPVTENVTDHVVASAAADPLQDTAKHQYKTNDTVKEAVEKTVLVASVVPVVVRSGAWEQAEPQEVSMMGVEEHLPTTTQDERETALGGGETDSRLPQEPQAEGTVDGQQHQLLGDTQGYPELPQQQYQEGDVSAGAVAFEMPLASHLDSYQLHAHHLPEAEVYDSGSNAWEQPQQSNAWEQPQQPEGYGQGYHGGVTAPMFDNQDVEDNGWGVDMELLGAKAAASDQSGSDPYTAASAQDPVANTWAMAGHREETGLGMPLDSAMAEHVQGDDGGWDVDPEASLPAAAEAEAEASLPEASRSEDYMETAIPASVLESDPAAAHAGNEGLSMAQDEPSFCGGLHVPDGGGGGSGGGSLEAIDGPSSPQASDRRWNPLVGPPAEDDVDAFGSSVEMSPYVLETPPVPADGHSCAAVEPIAAATSHWPVAQTLTFGGGESIVTLDDGSSFFASTSPSGPHAPLPIGNPEEALSSGDTVAGESSPPSAEAPPSSYASVELPDVVIKPTPPASPIKSHPAASPAKSDDSWHWGVVQAASPSRPFPAASPSKSRPAASPAKSDDSWHWGVVVPSAGFGGHQGDFSESPWDGPSGSDPDGPGPSGSVPTARRVFEMDSEELRFTAHAEETRAMDQAVQVASYLNQVLGNVRSGQQVPDSTLDYAISLVRALGMASAAGGRPSDDIGAGPSTSSGLGGHGGSGGGGGGISAAAAATTAAVQDLIASETTPTKMSATAAAAAEAERAAEALDSSTMLQTPQRLPSVSPYMASPGSSDASLLQHALIQSIQPYPAAASAAAASSSADTPQWPGTPADGAAAVVDQQQEFASQVAALRRELQDEFEQQLMARGQELEARFESRLADMRAELEAEYERRLAEKDAEIAELRLKCTETQDDLDQLLLCLGQESRKVTDLAQAMRDAGLDPDEVTGPIDEEYASMELPEAE